MREDTSAVRWQLSPSQSLKPAGRIVKVLPGKPATWILLSDRLVGVVTHYTADKRTVPCTAREDHPRRECHVDHRYTSLRWQGWVAVQAPLMPVPQFLALTPSAVRDCPFLLDRSKSLRGVAVEVGRRSGNVNSSMRVQVCASDWSSVRLAAPPDVAGFLMNLWGPIVAEALEADARRNTAELPKGGLQ